MEVLANDGSSPRDWNAARAGLLVLRHVDAWASGEWLPNQLFAEREAVAGAVAEVGAEDPFRGLLAAVLARTAREWTRGPDGQPAARAPRFSRVSAPLLAYGRALEFASQWSLAADVYLTVWEGTGPQAPGADAADLESAAIAAQRLGICYRTLGELDRACAAYGEAENIARQRGDQEMVLSARLGLAKVVQDRGNFPLADQRFAEILGDATTARLQDIRARAYHNRGELAYSRGAYCNAVEWMFEAWALQRDANERERVLCDLALALLGAGYRSLARHAYQVLASTGGEPWTRWIATINLLEIATLDGDEMEFGRHRRTLREVALPPRLAANFSYYAGLGDAAFGRADHASAELERAMTIARQHGFGELYVKAEAALTDVLRGAATPPRDAGAPLPPEYAYISEALHEAWAGAAIGAH